MRCGMCDVVYCVVVCAVWCVRCGMCGVVCAVWYVRGERCAVRNEWHTLKSESRAVSDVWCVASGACELYTLCIFKWVDCVVLFV